MCRIIAKEFITKDVVKLTFESKKPEGLSAVKDGDMVSVVYTGNLEQVEAFTGTIVSVTKE